jgi:hypothetical protein
VHFWKERKDDCQARRNQGGQKVAVIFEASPITPPLSPSFFPFLTWKAHLLGLVAFSSYHHLLFVDSSLHPIFSSF